jgi:hypothetical protein
VVVALDQPHLPLAPPAFEALLQVDGVANVAVAFEPDETGDVVLPAEARLLLGPVLGDAPLERIRHAHVERAVAAACEYVDPTGHAATLA